VGKYSSVLSGATLRGEAEGRTFILLVFSRVCMQPIAKPAKIFKSFLSEPKRLSKTLSVGSERTCPERSRGEPVEGSAVEWSLVTAPSARDNQPNLR